MHFNLFSILLFASGLPVILADFTEESAYQYLKQFGYISNTPETPTQRDSGDTTEYDHNFQQELLDFQSYAGLQKTGELDKATKEAMQALRCGVKDHEEGQSQSNQHSGLFGKWEKKKLTYRIVKYSQNLKYNLKNSEVDKICRKAMDLWEGAADIRFEERLKGNVDIEISFGSRNHGDEKCGGNFDGPGNVLAHAFYPHVPRSTACPKDISGDIHIDDDEDWSVTYDEGTDLLHTITHELGHSLGLDHAKGFEKDTKSPIMHSHHPGWVKNLILHQDDIERIQKLYGNSSQTVTTPSEPTTKPTPVSIPTASTAKPTQSPEGHIETIEPGAQHDKENAIWGQDEWCRTGSFATGIDVKIQYNQGSIYDDSALNSIKLICSGLGGHSNITSLGGSNGEWRGAKRCSAGYITGVSLRSEKYQGKFKDDTAANGIRAICQNRQEIKNSNFEKIKSSNFEGIKSSNFEGIKSSNFAGYWGTWSEVEYCPDGTAICGLRTKVMLEYGWRSLDNVGLTRVIFHCCSTK